MKFPRSDYDETRGVVFFGRMLDKIRLQAAGELPPGYNLGTSHPTFFDTRFCTFWGVDYERIRALTLQGHSDEDVFDAIFAGRTLNPGQVLAWNAFLTKRGWRDAGSAEMKSRKAECGFADRSEIQTYADLHDADEGRPTRFRE